MSEEPSNRTFWEVISENQIEIPVIQRDYAQGRINDRVNQIRNKFVKDIVDAIKGEGNPLPLDFVYGRIQGKDQEMILLKNNEAIRNVLLAVQGYAENLQMDITYEVSQKNGSLNKLSSTKFIPLDGQQRLTTLFLLHWYLVQRMESNDQETQLDILKGFKYKTRKSTTEFCEYLTNISGDHSKRLFVKEKKVSEQIEKSTKFFKIWKNDPSVKGMLVMIDAFHKELKNEGPELLSKMWILLTEKRMITFDFLDLDMLDQTDELYVKMNARGKQLTDFEHFKAWLQEYIKEEKISIKYENWERKLDTTWLDFLWMNKADGNYEIDNIYYGYIKTLTLYEYIVQTEKEKIYKSLIDKIRESNEEKSFIPLNDFKKQKFFSSENLSFLFKTLDSFSEGEFDIINNLLIDIYCKPFATSEKKLNRLFVSADHSSVNLWDTVYYYALILFLNDRPDFQDEEVIKNFRSWMRICRNLIYNTYIQNPDNFIDAIKSLSELSKNKYTLTENLLSGDLNISFFNNSQLKEEIRKLEYFNKGIELKKPWKEMILQFENHEYFYGQIDFIFNLLDESNTENFELFEMYGNKLCKIFDKKDNRLFQTALLSKIDYLQTPGNRRSFCKFECSSLRARNDNWRKVFNDPNKLNSIKTLLNDDSDFKTICETYEMFDWRGFSIDYPETIEYCNNRLIDWYSDLDIKLIKESTYQGKHTDFYLYVLYKKLNKLITKDKLEGLGNIKLSHKDINGYRNNNKYPVLEIAHGNKVLITINYSYSINLNQKGFEVKPSPNFECNLFTEFERTAENVFHKPMENISEMKGVLDYLVDQIRILDASFNI